LKIIICGSGNIWLWDSCSVISSSTKRAQTQSVF